MLWPRGLRTPSRTRVSGLAWTAVLVAGYVLQLRLGATLAIAGHGPLAVVTWAPGGTLTIVALLACAAFESYALLALYRTGAPRAAVAAGAIVMALLSIATPLLFNADLYAYVGNGLLGRAAYTAPHTPFHNEFSAINHWWGVPVPSATYGPLWLAIARMTIALPVTLFGKLLALRCLGAASVACTVALLRAFGLRGRLLALVALNPALYWQFVLDAHNDLLPAAIVVVAALAARFAPWLAALAIAVAALVKLPYALLGLPVLAVVKRPGARWAAALVAVVAATAISWGAGGRAYAAALLSQTATAGTANVLHGLAAALAVAVTLAAIASPRRLRSAVWLLPSVAPYTAPWYAIWSLPYAMQSRRALVYLLVALPVVCALVEPSLARWWTVAIAVPLAAIAGLRITGREARRSNRVPSFGRPR